MSPKPRRSENKSLPARWRFKHGAYYYRVPPGQEAQWDGRKEFRLGADLAKAYHHWADRIRTAGEARTIGELLDRYALQVLPRKAPTTQREQKAGIGRLRAVFGDMPIDSLRPVHVYQYLDRRGKVASTGVLREVEVLSHAYTKAVEWGLVEDHPIRGKVRRTHPKPRTRYIEDWELLAALKVASPMLQAYLRIKLLTGLRRGDLLRLQLRNIRDDGIHVTTRKTGRPIIYEWSDELRRAVDLARGARRKVYGLFLFATRDGQPYIRPDGSANGWDSLWQRFIRRVLDKTEVQERFTEHDLRAKCASDAESLERACELLAHADTGTTRRFYRRRPERIRPLK